MIDLLKKWHFEAFPAGDSVDALRQIYHVSPHVVVTDAELGNCAGFELSPFLRRRFPEVGVIALVREPNPTKYLLDGPFADEVVPIRPFEPVLIGASLVSVSGKYPFRQDCEVEDAGSSQSGGCGYDGKMQLAP